jgi:hypothetical protein
MRFHPSFAAPLLLAVSAATPAALPVKRVDPAPDECKKSALLAYAARVAEVKAEYLLALADSVNIADDDERKEFLADAKASQKESLAEAKEQREARLELCGHLPSGPYDPAIDPANFTVNIDNPFFPLVPGAERTYHKQTKAGLEVTTVTVTSDTKVVQGVTCRVVRDVVKVNNVVEEDTLDYFAQDLAGNVWYFGELSMEFANGELASLEGSWCAGVDGAKAGIIMKAAPAVDDTYRQEFFLGEAEDAATVLSLTATASVPYGDFTNCLQTRDFTPLEPGPGEHKYYAPGVGLVLEVDVESGTRVELVSIMP